MGAKTRLTLIKQVDNRVDAAIALPTNPDIVTGEVLDIGVPVGVIEPSLGMCVRKSGRTTCLTVGEVDTLDLTVRVSYDYNTALFIDQIGIQPVKPDKFSEGGDSGSAILNEENRLVALLFAGDETGYTIANNFGDVMELLEVEPL